MQPTVKGSRLAMADFLASLLFSDEENRKRTAWSNASDVPTQTDIRIDCDGRYIRWSDYGKLSEYGWEIDHTIPTALGGLNILGNIRARHWRGNRSAGGLLGGLMELGRKGY